MPNASDTIQILIASRKALAKATDTLSATDGQPLQDLIDDLNTEIDDLTAAELDTADYVPQTDPFKPATDQGKAFIARLEALKDTFAKIDAVVSAATSILGVITKLA